MEEETNQSGAMLLATFLLCLGLFKTCEYEEMEQKKQAYEHVKEDASCYQAEKGCFAGIVMEKLEETNGCGKRSIDLAVEQAMNSSKASDQMYRDTVLVMATELRVMEENSPASFYLVVRGYADCKYSEIINGFSSKEKIAEKTAACMSAGLKSPKTVSKQCASPEKTPEARQRGN